MAGVGAPGVILPPGASPHGYALRPSEARMLQEADLVVWVGPALTPWLAEPIAALAPAATVLDPRGRARASPLLPARAGGPFEAGHDAGRARPHARPRRPPTTATSGSTPRTPSPPPGRSPPRSASSTRPAPPPTPPTPTPSPPRPPISTRSLAAELAPLRGRPFLVFHDAYRYFEHRFGIPAAGSVALSEGVPPGAARVAALRDRVRREGIVCAFTEPQFEPRLLATIIEGSDVRTGVLDPLGASLAPGPDLYPALLRGLADNLEACLAD